MNSKKSGQNVKLLRIKAGLSQADFAQKVGLSRPTISLIEKDKRDLTLTEVQSICKVLGCSLEELLKTEDISSNMSSPKETSDFEASNNYDLYNKYKKLRGNKEPKPRTETLDSYLSNVNPFYYNNSNSHINYGR